MARQSGTRVGPIRGSARRARVREMGSRDWRRIDSRRQWPPVSPDVCVHRPRRGLNRSVERGIVNDHPRARKMHVALESIAAERQAILERRDPRLLGRELGAAAMRESSRARVANGSEAGLAMARRSGVIALRA